jgi:hypothetical protein
VPAAVTLAEMFDRVRLGAGGCWLYTGAVDRDGFAVVRVGLVWDYGHRWADRSARGPIPDGFKVRQTCGVHRCINPDHVERVPKSILLFS